MRIVGATKVIGYVGSTFATSKVYDLYNLVFPKLGIDFVYVPFNVKEIGPATRAMPALGIHAIGVTIPFKVSIIPHLDEVDEYVRRSGAVNVVRNDGGRLVGSNTDGLGALRALEEAIDPRERQIVLIGGGGAARAIAAELVRAGAVVSVVSISDDEARAVAGDLGCSWSSWHDRRHTLARAEVIINATPVGMAGTATEGQSPIPTNFLHGDQVVMDVVATPRRTHLLEEAAALGCRTVSGERMLLWQALLKFEIFTGQAIGLEIMEQALHPAPPKRRAPLPIGAGRYNGMLRSPGTGE